MSVQPDETISLEKKGAIATSPGPKRIPTGIVRVNLIPAELAEARQLKLTAMAAAGVAVIAIGVVGVLYHQQSAKVSTAQDALSAAQTQNQKLQLEQSRLGNVDALYAKVDSAEAMLSTVEAPQVLWSRYLEDLRLQLPEHVWLTNLAATETGASATAAVTTGSPTSTTTSTAATIGTLTFSGAAYTHNDVADLLDRLAGLKGVTNPYLSSSTEALVGSGSTAVPTVTWSSTASLTTDALKSAYDGTATP